MTNQVIPIEAATFDFGQPQLDVEGKVESVTLKPNSQNPIVQFNLLGTIVHEATVPWDFPQYTVEAPYNPRSPRFQVLATSVQAIKGTGFPMGKLVGSTVRWRFTGGHVGSKPNPDKPGEWMDAPMEAWTIYSIDGARAQSSPPPDQLEKLLTMVEDVEAVQETSNNDTSNVQALLIDIAVGETEESFQKAALNDKRLAGTELFQEILDKNAGVLAELLAAGTLVRNDEGKYQVA